MITPLLQDRLLVFRPWLCLWLARSFNLQSIFLMSFGLKLVLGSDCLNM